MTDLSRRLSSAADRCLEPSIPLPALTPFVAAESLERIHDVPMRLRLGANESPFGISPHAVEAMQRAATEANLYGDPDNHDLRVELAHRLDVDVSNVMVTAGIDEVLLMLVRRFVGAGAVGVVSAGTYPMFPVHVAGFGGRIEAVPYRDDRNDVDALLERAAVTNARAVYLANPDNPSGSQLRRSELDRLFDGLPAKTLLILDEAYVEFADADDIPPINIDDSRVVRLRTFSKVHGLAGARVGYAIGAKSLLDEVEKVRLNFGVNRAGQIGALAALRDDAHVHRVVVAARDAARHYAAMGERLGIPMLSTSTNFACFDVGGHETAVRLREALARRGVFVRLPWASPLDRCVRIGLASSDAWSGLERDLRACIATTSS